jgi:hypothetical protein
MSRFMEIQKDSTTNVLVYGNPEGQHSKCPGLWKSRRTAQQMSRFVEIQKDSTANVPVYGNPKGQHSKCPGLWKSRRTAQQMSRFVEIQKDSTANVPVCGNRKDSTANFVSHSGGESGFASVLSRFVSKSRRGGLGPSGGVEFPLQARFPKHSGFTKLYRRRFSAGDFPLFFMFLQKIKIKTAVP